MSSRYLAPYVNFQGKAREAMEFYRDALGGKLEVNEWEGRVALATLETDGLVLQATDGHPKFAPAVGENMAVAFGAGDAGEVTRIFNALAAGGKIKGPLSEQQGGRKTGYLVDRFGINWIVTIL